MVAMMSSGRDIAHHGTQAPCCHPPCPLPPPWPFQPEPAPQGDCPQACPVPGLPQAP